jgi:hypothetical protein
MTLSLSRNIGSRGSIKNGVIVSYLGLIARVRTQDMCHSLNIWRPVRVKHLAKVSDSLKSNRHEIVCFKVTEGLHILLHRAALSQHCSYSSLAKVLVLNRLYSPRLRCSRCNVVRFCCDLEIYHC